MRPKVNFTLWKTSIFDLFWTPLTGFIGYRYAILPILATIWSMLKTIVESINIDLIPGVHK